MDQLNNHGIDDNVDNMRINYELAMFGKLAVRKAELSTPPVQPRQTPSKKYRKKDPYLDVIMNYR